MRVLLFLLSALALSGCSTLSYYAQSIGGHLDLTSRARRVDEVLADANSPAALKERLQTAAAIRQFASRDLKLPDNGSYRSYAALDRPYALWNVVAAPEFSLRPVQWCFPIAGCVTYRGYYAQAAAESYAASLRAQGNDVMVYGVPAYSTLGWFDDPLLSSFIHYAHVELARLVFHELAHQVVYVKGDSTFNESFAAAVEREGVRRWIKERKRESELQEFEARVRRSREVELRVAATRERLEALYRLRLAPEAMRERKRAELEVLRPQLAALRGLQGVELNNAFLASFATYTEQVPGFERMLGEAGGDLARFYDRVRELARLPREARDALLR